jgi:formamidopyrimidine-DNA glycosylase
VLIVFTVAREGERDAPALALHFGMTGHLVVDDPVRVHPWDRVVLDLDDGTSVRYRNMRRLGFVRLVSRSDLADLLWGMGPDALEAPGRWFGETLARRRAPVKAVLLDQGFVSGVGNIYADEALHVAEILPERPANAIAPDEAKRLHTAMRRVLRRGTMRVPRVRDAPCPRCGTPIRSKTIGGRTAYYCARCQR